MLNSPENNPDKAAKVFADDRANVFHSWSAQAQISPMAIAGGAGSYFWDFTGKKYLDFSCQLVFTNMETAQQYLPMMVELQDVFKMRLRLEWWE